MLNRKQLDQMTDEELEKIYNDIKKELDEKKAKNRRIRGILSRKIKEKEESLNNLKNQINEVLANHPELKKRIIYEKNMIKQDFDDTKYDPKELKKSIQDKQKFLSQLQSKKLQIEKDIPALSNHIKQQKLVEEQFQNEINLLISQTETLSDSESSEILELDQLSKDIQSAQEELDALNIEIEELRKEVHQQG